LVRVALRALEPAFSVLFIHGPGGVGKSCLLDALARLADELAVPVVRLDGGTVPASRSSVTDALGDPTGNPPDRAAPRVGPSLVLIDAFERFAPLEGWIRTDLLPHLPASTVTVIAGRLPPSPQWRADSAWNGLLRVVSLRNLDPEDSRDYLRAVGVAEELWDQVVRAAHGHPFALALLADIVLRGGAAYFDPLPPDLVRALVDRLLDLVPTELHRLALGVCAIARVTTQGLLRDVVAQRDVAALDPRDIGEVGSAFAWLRDLSFIHSDEEGLHPDDLSREVLDAELRWRDPEGYRAVLMAVWRHVRAQAQSSGPREQRKAIHDLKFLFRNLTAARSPVDWSSWATVQPEPEPVLPSDHGSIVALVSAAEGPESADIASMWLDRQPSGFSVLRRADGSLRGVVGLLDLSRVAPQDVLADPGSRAAWAHATGHPGLRAGEVVSLLRVLVDADAYQDPSPTLNAAPVLQMQQFLRSPQLSWGFLAMSDPDRWNEYFAVADLPRVGGGDFVVGGRTYGLFGHDFRMVPVNAWIDLVVERGLSGNTEPAELIPTGRLLVLSQAEFEQAVRQALRDLSRPAALGRNPLVRTRLVHSRLTATRTGAHVLEALLRDAVDTLTEDPRDDRLLRAVDRTFVRPAATQESAAAMLGVPFSSYRRHLSQGIARIVSWLWEQELHGDPIRD